MQAFEYVAPKSVNEAISALAAGGEKARALSGGTDLISQLQEGRRKLDTVVDVKRIPELTVIAVSANGLTLGAAASCRSINANQAVRDGYPALIDSTHLIGGTQIQVAPASEAICATLLPLAMEFPISLPTTSPVTSRPQWPPYRSGRGFLYGAGQKCARKRRVPGRAGVSHAARQFRAAYLRFIPRNEMDIAVVGAGVSVVLSDDKKTIQSARVSLGAVAPTPLLVQEAGDALSGQPASEQSLAKAAELAKAAARPINDMRGTIAQRKHLSAVLTQRALRIAIDRARGTKTVDVLGRLNGHG